uniref:Uncharacterized protein n=1 Tax=Ditylenchus dipsaci TaxID=166011 RepID=A0A915D9E2_9BILA
MWEWTGRQGDTHNLRKWIIGGESEKCLPSFGDSFDCPHLSSPFKGVEQHSGCKGPALKKATASILVDDLREDSNCS